MANKVFNPAEWLEEPKTSANHISPIDIPIEEKIEQLVCSIESSSVDIAPDYASWRDLGFALSDALGEGGRSFFHRLSRFYSGYDEKDADDQYTKCLKSRGSGITIGTLFHLAIQAGITLPKTLKSYNVIPSERRNEDFNSPKSPKSPVGDIGDLEEINDSQPDETLPTFSKDVYSLLPDFLLQIINKAKNFEDADLLTLGAITALSACLPNVSGIYDEREVFPNLFLFVSAQASAGKGRLTLCRHLVKPIHDNLKQLYALEMEEYKRKQNEYVLDKKNNEPPVEPPIKTLLIPANSSSTAVYQMLNDNNGTGLIFETEGDTLANTFKSDYGNFSDGFRKAFHHEMISYTRRKDREYVELARPRLSAVLSGTPRQIISLINDSENGLFSRFIFYKMNFLISWRDVFAKTEQPLDDYFLNLGKQFFAFYQTLQNSQPIRFSFTQPQQEEFNAFFEKKQNEFYYIFGEDIIASVRRLGLITFRIAMILTTLRIMEGKDMSQVIVCDDTDFRTSLIMAEVLLKHTGKVFGNLPVNEETSSNSGQTIIRQKFFDSLPPEFDRRTYLAIAERLNMPPKTAEKQITRLCEKGKLKHTSHGCYSKP